MAHLTDVFSASGTVQFGPLSGHAAPLINIPPPGQAEIGGSLSGLITDIIQRIPIPRPRLPAPRGPTGRGPSRFPIPIPIPLPGGLFDGGDSDCPGCCKGFHLNKQETKDGSPPGSKCVRNRSMNSLNPKALRRATRRLKGFERAVKSTRKQLRTLAKI